MTGFRADIYNESKHGKVRARAYIFGLLAAGCGRVGKW